MTLDEYKTLRGWIIDEIDRANSESESMIHSTLLRLGLVQLID